MAVAPEALVGRRVSLWWPDEGAWFGGTVGAYDAGSGQHTARSRKLSATISSTKSAA
jgi:hypothetical protein